MWRLIKFFLYVAILVFVGLVVYAYIGPLLGVDFAPALEEQNVPVTIGQDS